MSALRFMKFRENFPLNSIPYHLLPKQCAYKGLMYCTSSSSHSNADLTHNAMYDFRARSVNSAGNGEYSEVQTVRIIQGKYSFYHYILLYHLSCPSLAMKRLGFEIVVLVVMINE